MSNCVFVAFIEPWNLKVSLTSAISPLLTYHPPGLKKYILSFMSGIKTLKTYKIYKIIFWKIYSPIWRKNSCLLISSISSISFYLYYVLQRTLQLFPLTILWCQFILFVSVCTLGSSGPDGNNSHKCPNINLTQHVNFVKLLYFLLKMNLCVGKAWGDANSLQQKKK